MLLNKIKFTLTALKKVTMLDLVFSLVDKKKTHVNIHGEIKLLQSDESFYTQ